MRAAVGFVPLDAREQRDVPARDALPQRLAHLAFPLGSARSGA